MARLELLASSGNFEDLLRTIRVEGMFIQLNPKGDGIRQVFLGITDDNFIIAEQKLTDYKKCCDPPNDVEFCLELEGLELLRAYPLRFLHASVIDDVERRIGVCTCMGHVTYFELCNTDESFEANWFKWKYELGIIFGTDKNFEVTWKDYFNTFKTKISETLYFFSLPDTSLLLRSVSTQTGSTSHMKDTGCVHKIRTIPISTDRYTDKSTTTMFSYNTAPNTETDNREAKQNGKNSNEEHLSPRSSHSEGFGKKLKRRFSLKNKSNPSQSLGVSGYLPKKRMNFFSHSVGEFEAWSDVLLPTGSRSAMLLNTKHRAQISTTPSSGDILSNSKDSKMTPKEVGLMLNLWREESIDHGIKELKRASLPLKLHNSIQKICEEQENNGASSKGRNSKPGNTTTSASNESITDLVEEYKIQERRTNLWKVLKSKSVAPKRPKSTLEELMDQIVFKKCLAKSKCVEDFNVKDVSEQLTLIHKHLILQIPLREIVLYFAQPFHENKLLKISKLFRTTHQISVLIIREITSQSEPSRQAEIIKLWTEVAYRCKNNNDFQSAFLVVAGLQNIAVYRLSKAWEIISSEFPDSMKTCLELAEYFSKNKNYMLYTLNQLQKKKYSKRIPWLFHFLLHEKLVKKNINGFNYMDSKFTSQYIANRDKNGINKQKTVIGDEAKDGENGKVQSFCNKLVTDIYESSKRELKQHEHLSSHATAKSPLKQKFPHSVLVHEMEKINEKKVNIQGTGKRTAPALDLSKDDGELGDLKGMFPNSQLLKRGPEEKKMSPYHECAEIQHDDEQNVSKNMVKSSDNSGKTESADHTKQTNFGGKFQDNEKPLSKSMTKRKQNDVITNGDLKSDDMDDTHTGTSLKVRPNVNKQFQPRRSIYQGGQRRKSCFEKAIEQSENQKEDSGFELSVKSQLQVLRRGSKISAIFEDADDKDENNSFGSNSPNRRVGSDRSVKIKNLDKHLKSPSAAAIDKSTENENCILCGKSKCLYNSNYLAAFIQLQIAVSRVTFTQNKEIENYLLNSKNIQSDYQNLLSSLNNYKA